MMSTNAIEDARRQLCFQCPLKDCVDCYESPHSIKRTMFNLALEIGIPEEMVRKMFVGGSKM